MMRYIPHGLALLVACGIIISGIGLLYYSKWLTNTAYQPLNVRVIETITLPPPPAPPKHQQQDIELPDIHISAQGAGAHVDITLLQPDIDIQQQPIELHINMPKQNWDENLSVDWQAFSLEQLDNLPQLLRKPTYTMPHRLKNQGVKKFDIALDVVIDTKGKVRLIKIKENPYPIFNKEIQHVVKSARFTTPQKNGRPVKARFIWPLEIGSL